TPAQAGTVTLYKMQPGGFLPTTTTVGTDGTYAFTKVVLDNYQLLGEADTTLYPDALPTYYESTTFWEQADSIVVSANTPDLDIIARKKPGSLSGHGSVRGHLGETESEGRLKEEKRIANIGVNL